jgi:hypothetical protein
MLRRAVAPAVAISVFSFATNPCSAAPFLRQLGQHSFLLTNQHFDLAHNFAKRGLHRFLHCRLDRLNVLLSPCCTFKSLSPALCAGERDLGIGGQNPFNVPRVNTRCGNPG